jgi:chaperonin cofactor prefoldin
MKIWLIIISVVVVLLAASTGVGFWMLTDVKADLMDTEAELIGTQEKLEENFGYWWDETAGEEYWQQKVIFPPWERKKTAEETIYDLQQRVEELEEASSYWWESTTGGYYPWRDETDESISDLEQRVEDLEWIVQDLEWIVGDLERQISQLESTLHIHGIY